MSLTAMFFIFGKKRNSTGTPASESGLSTQIELKDDCSIRDLQMYIMPLNTGSTTYQPYQFNYCYVPEFSRYYFIEDWTWDHGRWLARCTVDTMGSFKNAIKASIQYVTRAATYYNERITDALYPTIAHTDLYSDVQNITSARPITTLPQYGYYIVGIITQGGEDGSGVTGTLGVVNYYLFSQAAFKKFKRKLFNSISWTGIADATMNNDVLKAFFNPIEYIASCKWAPITNISMYGVSATNQVAFGWWVFTFEGSGIYLFNDTSLMFTIFNWSVSADYISKHPQASTRGKYLYYEPFSEYDLYVPPYGVVHLPSIVSEAGFNAVEYVDFITGKTTMFIFVGQDHSEEGVSSVPYVRAETNLFIDVQLAQVRSTGGVQATLADAGAGLIGSWLDKLPDGAIKNGVTGIVGAVRDSMTTVSTVGESGGGFADLNFNGSSNGYTQVVICGKFQHITEGDVNLFGRPYCQSDVLGRLTGFAQCANAKIAIPGTEEEARQIEEYLNTGFFIE